MDKLFWVLARRFWTDWKKSLLVVTPETVVRWHRAGFRLYWSLLSRVKKQVGRKSLSNEIRDLIFRLVAENPTWGAPRIHGELVMLESNGKGTIVEAWLPLGASSTVAG
jgi:putative transposase